MIGSNRPWPGPAGRIRHRDVKAKYGRPDLTHGPPHEPELNRDSLCYPRLALAVVENLIVIHPLLAVSPDLVRTRLPMLS